MSISSFIIAQYQHISLIIFIYKAKKVMLIGGGSCELALRLKNNGKDVSLVEAEDSLFKLSGYQKAKKERRICRSFLAEHLKFPTPVSSPHHKKVQHTWKLPLQDRRY